MVTPVSALLTKMENGCLQETVMSPIREMIILDLNGTMTQVLENLEIELLINSTRDLYANNTTNRKFNYVRIS